MQKNVVDIFYNQMTNIIQDTQEPSSGGQEIEFQEIESFFDQEVESLILCFDLLNRDRNYFSGARKVLKHC
jgi:hypothetical protein